MYAIERDKDLPRSIIMGRICEYLYNQILLYYRVIVNEEIMNVCANLFSYDDAKILSFNENFCSSLRLKTSFR